MALLGESGTFCRFCMNGALHRRDSGLVNNISIRPTFRLSCNERANWWQTFYAVGDGILVQNLCLTDKTYSTGS